MTSAPSAGAGTVVQVLGRARAGDPVTATARGIAARLALAGRSTQVLAGDLPTGWAAANTPDALGEKRLDARVEAFRADRLDGTIVVHSVDGGEDLEPLLPALAGRRIRLLHHGSAVGSNRRALRGLRDAMITAAAVSPAAGEELRSLGFADVTVLPVGRTGGALDGVAADEATTANLDRHPGPLILTVGPIVPNRSLELLLDAFADLITRRRPSATLSICGPAARWYATALRRRVLALGLVACELVEPPDDRAVAARLDHADAVVSLHPTALDPYLERAARRGAAIVAPLGAPTVRHLGRGLVPIPSQLRRSDLVEALEVATASRRDGREGHQVVDDLTDADLLRLLRIG